jgi:hypothetical protein
MSVLTEGRRCRRGCADRRRKRTQAGFAVRSRFTALQHVDTSGSVTATGSLAAAAPPHPGAGYRMVKAAFAVRVTAALIRHRLVTALGGIGVSPWWRREEEGEKGRGVK